MELDQLRHFLKVAELASFTKAAEAISLSQPALSRSISRLEEEFGQPLFDRQTRRIVLNDAGKLLLGRAKQIVSMAEDAKAEICDDGKNGWVRVGAIPTIAPYFLPSKLHEFQEQYPGVQLGVQEDTTSDLLKKLANGVIDIAIAVAPIEMKYVDVEPLFDEELFLVLAADHRLTKQKKVTIEDIEKEPFVLLGEAHCLADNVISFCRQRAFNPITVERTSQLVMVQELVALNHGVSLVPAMAKQRDHCDSRKYISLAGDKPMRTIVMVTNPYRFQSKLQKSFQEHLRNGSNSTNVKVRKQR